ncbi:zinc finger CCCH domain-containing protein 56 [Striga asiatica]|uniref:Zinc finger CCCH domain-containing protein 56 n=1 Tax=Striga asiatica TaxID=4170 RepID=A0A5A7PHG6_STRAF|nr:zinc finger CCCH domain-containing protein 56 [Striga asiatica]
MTSEWKKGKKEGKNTRELESNTSLSRTASTQSNSFASEEARRDAILRHRAPENSPSSASLNFTSTISPTGASSRPASSGCWRSETRSAFPRDGEACGWGGDAAGPDRVNPRRLCVQGVRYDGGRAKIAGI